jgi:hypothetical protein
MFVGRQLMAFRDGYRLVAAFALINSGISRNFSGIVKVIKFRVAVVTLHQIRLVIRYHFDSKLA